MYIIIVCAIAFIVRFGLQWIFGKSWSIFLIFLWLALFLFFSLCKSAPLFPLEMLKGASCTKATLTILTLTFVPFIVAKVAIQNATGESAKSWVGGFLISLMGAGLLVSWLIGTFIRDSGRTSF